MVAIQFAQKILQTYSMPKMNDTKTNKKNDVTKTITTIPYNNDEQQEEGEIVEVTEEKC